MNLLMHRPIARITLALLFASLCLPSLTFAQSIQWRTDVEQATKDASSQQRFVLLHFSATWCRPCRNLETFVFCDPRVQREIEATVIPVNVDSDKHEDLVKKYGITAVPYDVVMTPAGRVLLRRKSPRDAEGYIAMISRLGKLLDKFGAGNNPGLEQNLNEIEELMKIEQAGFQAARKKISPDAPKHMMPRPSAASSNLNRFQATRSQNVLPASFRRDDRAADPKFVSNPFFANPSNSSHSKSNSIERTPARDKITPPTGIVNQQPNSTRLPSEAAHPKVQTNRFFQVDREPRDREATGPPASDPRSTAAPQRDHSSNKFLPPSSNRSAASTTSAPRVQQPSAQENLVRDDVVRQSSAKVGLQTAADNPTTATEDPATLAGRSEGLAKPSSPNAFATDIAQFSATGQSQGTAPSAPVAIDPGSDFQVNLDEPAEQNAFQAADPSQSRFSSAAQPSPTPPPTDNASPSPKPRSNDDNSFSAPVVAHADDFLPPKPPVFHTEKMADILKREHSELFASRTPATSEVTSASNAIAAAPQSADRQPPQSDQTNPFPAEITRHPSSSNRPQAAPLIAPLHLPKLKFGSQDQRQPLKVRSETPAMSSDQMAQLSAANQQDSPATDVAKQDDLKPNLEKQPQSPNVNPHHRSFAPPQALQDVARADSKPDSVESTRSSVDAVMARPEFNFEEELTGSVEQQNGLPRNTSTTQPEVKVEALVWTPDVVKHSPAATPNADSQLEHQEQEHFKSGDDTKTSLTNSNAAAKQPSNPQTTGNVTVGTIEIPKVATAIGELSPARAITPQGKSASLPSINRTETPRRQASQSKPTSNMSAASDSATTRVVTDLTSVTSNQSPRKNEPSVGSSNARSNALLALARSESTSVGSLGKQPTQSYARIQKSPVHKDPTGANQLEIKDRIPRNAKPIGVVELKPVQGLQARPTDNRTAFGSRQQVRTGQTGTHANATSGLASSKSEPLAPAPLNNVQASASLAIAAAQASKYALKGKCPVTLLTDGKWVQGSDDIGCIHRDRVYLFKDEEARATFLANPDRFSPLLAGFDPVVYLETGKLREGLESHGVFMGKAPNQRIVLFVSPDTKARFQATPSKYIANVRNAMEIKGQ